MKRDRVTPDLFDWSLPQIAVGFEADELKGARLGSKISRAVGQALRQRAKTGAGGSLMKLWFTASEFAELAAQGQLPGLPTSKRGMNLMIADEGWDKGLLCRPRVGVGGGFEYHLDVLPLPVRLAYAARHLVVADADVRPATPGEDGLSTKERALRDARAALLLLAERFRREQGLPTSTADDLFAGLFNARSISLPAWIIAEVPTISARSLARWRSLRDGMGSASLAEARGRPKRSGLDRALDGAVRTFVLAAIAKQPFLSAAKVRDLIADNFGEQIETPPLRSVQLALKDWKAGYRNELMLLTNPDGYRSTVEFAAVNATRTERLNQLWQIDASPSDVMLTEGRHSIYLAIDAFSRRVVVLVSKTPRASAVGLLMRKAIAEWGVPEKVKTDNGSDFTAQSTQRLFSALGIEVELSPPYQPKSKGMVERAIGTFQRDLTGLPGFIGHSVADRKIIENRKAFNKRLGADMRELFDVQMNAADLQGWCDDWAGTIYAHNPHEGLKRRTPYEVAARYAGPVRRIERMDGLDMLLAPIAGGNGLRVMTKEGVRVDGARYLTGSVMPGTEVLVRMDPADMGRAFLFEPDGETYLGEAVCPELAGLDPVATISRVKAEQKAYVAERLKDIRPAMRRIGPRAVADAMRNQAAKRASNLIAFPVHSDTHSTPALEAAGQAGRPLQPQALTGKAADLHEEIARELAGEQDQRLAPRPKVAQLPETAAQRFRRALDMEKRLAEGGALSDQELLWLGGYREGPEYRARRQMFEEFGEAAISL